MSNPRIPVVITDKNNRVTTVYRNQLQDQLATNVPRPPVISDSVGVNEYRVEWALDTMGIDPHSDFGVRNITYLAKHDPQLLDSIVELCTSDDDEKRLWLVQLCNYGLPGEAEYMDDAEYVKSYRWRYELQRTAIKVMAVVDPGYTGHFPTDNLLENVHLANHQRPVDDWEYQHARVIAIGIEGQSPRRGTDAFNDDVEFISKNREVVESILPELAERRTVDREVIQALVSNPSPSLREGAL